MTGSVLNATATTDSSLYDHRPYTIFEDDHIRVCKIPKRKVGLLELLTSIWTLLEGAIDSSFFFGFSREQILGTCRV